METVPMCPLCGGLCYSSEDCSVYIQSKGGMKRINFKQFCDVLREMDRTNRACGTVLTIADYDTDGFYSVECIKPFNLAGTDIWLGAWERRR